MGQRGKLMPWSDVAEKVGLSEDTTRRHATNALRKLRLGMRIQELGEEGLPLQAIVQICVQEQIVVGKSEHWIRGYVKGILGVTDGN